MYLQEITWILGILSFIGGIAIFLFKKIVIEPLQKSINSLNDTLKEFKKTTDKSIDLLEKRIDIVEKKTVKHETKLEFLLKGEVKHG